MQRRTLLQASAAAVLPLPAIGQSTRASTLRFVPQANLTLLDPVFTTAAVTTNHGFHVFDTLYGVDSKLQAKPQMAEGHTVSDDRLTWTIRLRPGLKFHDGEPVRATDCIASIARWSKRDAFGQVLARFTDSMEAIDDRTIRIRLKRPFAPLPDALAHPQALTCFMMPERLAKTDATVQITEMVGSGPYRFLKDEFVAGSAAAYAKFDGYVPRGEPADFTAGGKVAHFPRIEWKIIPDPATAGAALQSGEVDWWELPLPDLLPALSKNPGVTVQVEDPAGYISVLRFNCTIPPFDNPRLRHAIAGCVDQADYMRGITNDAPGSWRTCYAAFPCGLPHVAEIGAPLMRGPKDLERGKAAIRDAGYKGEKIVVINPTDYPAVGPLGQITADLLRRLGMNVELQEMDWGTVTQRRGSRATPDKGGWNIFHTFSTSIAVANPALNTFIRGQGNAGWFGWYDSPQTEALADQWLAADGEAAQQAVFDEMQRLTFENAPIVPLGQYFPSTAFRRDLTGILPGSVPIPWNVRRA